MTAGYLPTPMKGELIMSVNLLNYDELVEAALNYPTWENLNALGEWYEKYGEQYREGKCFIIDENHRLYRIYNRTMDIVGYELQ